MPYSFVQKRDNDYRRHIKNTDLGSEFKQLIQTRSALHALSKKCLARFCARYSLRNGRCETFNGKDDFVLLLLLFFGASAQVGQVLLIHEGSRSHTTTHHSR